MHCNGKKIDQKWTLGGLEINCRCSIFHKKPRFRALNQYASRPGERRSKTTDFEGSKMLFFSQKIIPFLFKKIFLFLSKNKIKALSVSPLFKSINRAAIEFHNVWKNIIFGDKKNFFFVKNEHFW